MDRKGRAFLSTVAQIRIQQHYEKHFSIIRPNWARFCELAMQYDRILSRLSEEDRRVVREYQDYVFESAAATERVLYQAGVKDGMKLGRLLKKIR